MSPEFGPLREELEQWDCAGRICAFWWRDDDLQRSAPELSRLREISERHTVPVMLAVIPGLADAALGHDMRGTDTMAFCQHGWMHANHEPEGAIRSEFGASRALSEIEADIRAGHDRLREVFGERFFPVFVPPWNTLADEAIELLPRIGFAGLSCYGTRPDTARSRNLKIVNAHLDILE